VEHEDIPGFMPAMTMPFNYHSEREIQSLKVGDSITFQLVVTERDSWMQAVRRIEATNLRPARVSTPTAQAKGARLKEGDALPDFELTDDQSKRVTRATFAGKPLLLTFIYTRCPVPSFCPMMSRNFADIRKEFAGNAAAGMVDLQCLSISFDPELDTPERLARYAERIAVAHNGWHFACGTPEQITRLTREFSVYVRAESGAISHGLCTALVGPDGKIRRIWRGNAWAPSEAVAAVRELTPTLAGRAQASVAHLQ
jgi:protein SCO1